jgi:putative serine protease PepD
VSSVYRRTRLGVVDLKVTTGGAWDGSSSGAEGTGFVLDRAGDIVTNQHVVHGATGIQVTFGDGTRAAATLVGEDASADVAVIRVDAARTELQPLAFARTGTAVGEEAIAIGSPYGLSETLTAGIVSSLGRTIDSPDGSAIRNAIQTDAAINEGNSGGPLLNLDGAVIGMNAQIATRSGGNVGIGFAIPAATVKAVAARLIAGGAV